MEGWIKIHRKMLDWEWYNDPNTLRLFLHLLLTANIKESRWCGVAVMAGQLIVGRKKLSKDLEISEQSIRTSLNRLKSTNEITIKSTKKFSLITICKWEQYQYSGLKFQPSKQPADQPTANQQSTNNQPTANHKLRNKERIESKEGKEQKKGEYEIMFEVFRDHYPGSKRGFEVEFENLKRKHKDWKEIVPLLSDSLYCQINARDELQRKAGFVPAWKNMQTWINQECWTEEINTNNISITNNGINRRNSRASDGSTAEDVARHFAVKLGLVTPGQGR